MDGETMQNKTCCSQNIALDRPTQISQRPLKRPLISGFRTLLKKKPFKMCVCVCLKMSVSARSSENP